jgi:hypothetical protein
MAELLGLDESDRVVLAAKSQHALAVARLMCSDG